MVDLVSGQQYVIDESGEPVLQEDINQTAEPTGGSQIPTNQAGIVGQAQSPV
jgi:hypothetical protein